MAKFRVFLACALIAVLAPTVASAQPSTADIQQRDELIHAQESLLNAYRCRFDIDVQIVPGGCANGAPGAALPSPGPFAGTPTDREIEIRDHLITTQEALLNAYRCRFSIDVHIVPGGCGGAEQETAVPQAIGPWDLHTGVLESNGEDFAAYVALGTAQKLTITDEGSTVEDIAVAPVFVVRCDAGHGLLVYMQMAGLIDEDPDFARVLVTWKFPGMEDAAEDLWTSQQMATGTPATTLWATPSFIEHMGTATEGLIQVLARNYNGYDDDAEWFTGRFAAEGAAEVLGYLTPCSTSA